MPTTRTTPTIRRPAFAVAAVLVALAAPPPGAAVESADLRNGDFETDLSFWETSFCAPEAPEDCVNAWAPFDRGGSPDSGSIRLRKTWVGGANLAVGQCLPATAFRTWHLRGFSNQDAAAEPAQAYLQLIFNDDEICEAYLDHSESEAATDPGIWEPLEVGPVESPDGTSSIEVRVVVYELESGAIDAEAYFDDLALGIFFAGFERGDLGEWAIPLP